MHAAAGLGIEFDQWTEQRQAAISRLRERGEMPPYPEGRTVSDIAADYDAMRAMTPEARLTVPYSAHGNYLLRCCQLIDDEMGDVEPPMAPREREPGEEG